ncbi:MAG TPA: endonuclease domain-containing protein [Anaerolineales bacterium]|nr:endonuclease domain-containing protein [Anaerolineales bacterium]
MHKRTTPKIFKRAKELRREMTHQERKLHSHLRAHRTGDVHFRPQHAIGNYIVDFCAPRRKVIIELDGSQHLEQDAYDMERTAFLESKGYRVLRFWNNDVTNNLASVLTVIWEALKEQEAKGSETSKAAGSN